MKIILKHPLAKLFSFIILSTVLICVFRQGHIDFSYVTTGIFRDKINSFGIWGPAAYIILFIVRPLVLFPAGIFAASAGVIWGIKGFLYLQIAANLSATVEFFIARYVARDAVKRLIKGRMENIDTAIEKRGFITVLLIRLIPNVLWDFQNLGLGLTKVRFRDYFWATLIGIIPCSFAFVYFGSSFIGVLTKWLLPRSP